MNCTKTLQLVALSILILTSACVTSSVSASGSGISTCGGTATVSASPTLDSTLDSTHMAVYVADPNTTGQVGYPNEPLVAVKICTPNHGSDDSQCQVIQNILLDTGSYGLRLFDSAINSNVNLAQVHIDVDLNQNSAVDSGETFNLAQCAVFGSGADWGPVKRGDVVLAGQSAVNIPIQVIDRSFPHIPGFCSDLHPDATPCDAGFNGILGIGPFAEDCRGDCASKHLTTNPGIYLACDSGECFNIFTNPSCPTDDVSFPHTCAVQVPQNVNDQIINPIASLGGGFGNGTLLSFKSSGLCPGCGYDTVTNDDSGRSEIEGALTLGITADPGAGVKVYQSDTTNINFVTNFDETDGHTNDSAGTAISYGSDTVPNPPGPDVQTFSFLDSGSNGIFFPSATRLALCSGSSSFYCPSSIQQMSGVIFGIGSGTGTTIPFDIARATTLFNNGNSAFRNLGGDFDAVFDWGLPFFLGRNVYTGIDGKTATFNSATKTGPYWAF